jgi:hypothetical protein
MGVKEEFAIKYVFPTSTAYMDWREINVYPHAPFLGN